MVFFAINLLASPIIAYSYMSTLIDNGCYDLGTPTNTQIYPDICVSGFSLGTASAEFAALTAILFEEPSARMTNDICAALAVSQGFWSFGTQFGYVCVAGPVFTGIDRGEYIQPATGCDIPCPGDAHQQCGGRCLTHFFSANTNQLPNLPPVSYDEVGCFRDCPTGGTGPLLPVSVLSHAQFNTYELCAELAGNLGYSVAGFRNTSCFAGTDTDLAKIPLDSQTPCWDPCAMTLFRVVTQNGTLAPTVFEMRQPVPTVQPSSSSTSLPTAPQPPSGPTFEPITQPSSVQPPSSWPTPRPTHSPSGQRLPLPTGQTSATPSSPAPSSLPIKSSFPTAKPTTWAPRTLSPFSPASAPANASISQNETLSSGNAAAAVGVSVSVLFAAAAALVCLLRSRRTAQFANANPEYWPEHELRPIRRPGFPTTPRASSTGGGGDFCQEADNPILVRPSRIVHTTQQMKNQAWI